MVKNEYALIFFFLSSFTGFITPGSANFRNFDKKNKTKNFWLNFCLNKECHKFLCELGIGHRRRQTIQMWNSSGEKGILHGITVRDHCTTGACGIEQVM